MAALARTQSTTRLQRLLRDPLGFVWRYALGWHSIRLEPEPLQLDPIAFGELVHELISGAITRLEPRPGFARASEDEIETAIAAASATILTAWPLRRSVPPGILWRHTVKEAGRRTTRGLASDEPTRADTRSWSEVPFGQDQPIAGELPWDATIKIPIAEAGLVYGGRIDRLDIRASGDGVQITDYKSTKPPPKTHRIALGQGRELQRVLYAMAVRTLLPEVRIIVARLIYLADEPAMFELRGDDSIARSRRSKHISCRLWKFCKAGGPRRGGRRTNSTMICAWRSQPIARATSDARILISALPTKSLVNCGIPPDDAY